MKKYRISLAKVGWSRISQTRDVVVASLPIAERVALDMCQAYMHKIKSRLDHRGNGIYAVRTKSFRRGTVTITRL